MVVRRQRVKYEGDYDDEANTIINTILILCLPADLKVKWAITMTTQVKGSNEKNK